MKNYTLKKFKYIFIAILSVMIIGSCGKLEDPLEGFKLYINYDIFDTFISIRFIDTATGELINSREVVAEIDGVHKDVVVDQLGNRKESHSTIYGLMSLALNPKGPFVPATDNSIHFSILSSANGYQDNLVEFSLNDVGVHNVNIYLEKTSSIRNGVKKYVREIPIRNSALVDSFYLSSTNGEYELIIPKETKLVDVSGAEISDTLATVEMVVYNSIGRAPVPQALVTDIEIAGSVEKKSFDLVRIASFSLRATSGALHFSNIDGVKMNLGIPSAYTNPATGSGLAENDILSVCDYSGQWQEGSKNTIQTIEDSLIVKLNSKQPSLIGIGIIQPVCNFSGNLDFSFSNTFPSEPVATRVSFYRSSDNKIIRNIDYSLSSQDLSMAYNVLVPQDTPAYLRIRQKSSANGFDATPAKINISTPCGQNYQHNVSLSSTSIIFKGQITFSFAEPFSNNSFPISISVYDASNNQRLISKTYTVSDNKTIQLETGVPKDKKLYLKFSATNQNNAFQSNPERVYIDDPSIPNQAWAVDLIPTNCEYSGLFNFNYNESFGSSPIEFKLIFSNKQTRAVVKEKIVSFEPNTTAVPFSVFLPKNEQFSVRIKRTGSGQKAQIYPYEFEINQSCNNNISWQADLNPAIEQLISYNITVECPSAEILPTLQGFYRTIWDDDWLDAEIVNGVIDLSLEKHGTYEVGLIIDGVMKIQEYVVDENDNNIRYQLDQDDCDKMGW